MSSDVRRAGSKTYVEITDLTGDTVEFVVHATSKRITLEVNSGPAVIVLEEDDIETLLKEYQRVLKIQQLI